MLEENKMKISNKQKRALEKITGKSWDSWHPEAVRAYFAFTDRSQHIEVSDEAEADFDELMFQHHWHSVTVEMWKEDFRNGLLFLWDFFKPQVDYKKWEEQGYPEEKPTFMYPDAYIKHAFEIYIQARGYIPIDEVSGCKEWAERLGVVK